MGSIKKNVVFSTILTTANYIFPLITFPYVSRVLGVTNIGICNFVDSIINYFALFAMMGINTIAIREIAANKENKSKLTKVFSSLLTLNLITSLIMIAILIASIFLVPRLYENKELMFVGVFKLLFNALLIEWLYKGIENFRYITIRSIIVRLIYVLLVFILVKSSSDYIKYYILTTIITIINGFINIIHSNNFVKYSLKSISISPYIKGFLILGAYNLLTSMYTTFNVAYLGFVGGNKEVGFYSTATKLHGIILAIFTAFTNVMLPRMSSLISEHKENDFKRYFHRSISVLFAFSIPLIFFSIIFSDQIIRWIAGPGYESAIPCMQIVMPLVFIIGYEQILVIQILIPLKKDNYILYNSAIGAIIGILANFILVPMFHSVGSSLVWLISEGCVLITAQCFVYKITRLRFQYKRLLQYLFSSIPLIIGLIFFHTWNPVNIYTVFFAFAITIIYYAILEVYIFKNEEIIHTINIVVKRLRQ
jgi:O-antigen/teichoic acid export membrane protein